MHVYSMLMIAFGMAFAVLAALLAHEVISAGDRKPAACLRLALTHMVSRTVLNYEKDIVFGTVVPVILFLVLPGAALLNALLGGSPFLLGCYLLIAVSVLVHLLLAEQTGTGVRAALAALVALLGLVVLPYYAVWSLTNHMIISAPLEGALSGTLIAVILYAANVGIWTILRSSAGNDADPHGAHHLAAMIFAVPIGYVAYWFLLICLQMSGMIDASAQGWAVLSGVVIATAITFVIFKALLDLGEGARNWLSICVATGLSLLALVSAMAID